MKGLWVFLVFSMAGCSFVLLAKRAPDLLQGAHVDDYDNTYHIVHDRWVHEGYATYHIVRWNLTEQYLIARNDEGNAADGGLWTRVDWMELEGMPPYEWAFCLTVYNASSFEEAEQSEPADRAHPRAGCNGFPFSRMKRAGIEHDGGA